MYLGLLALLLLGAVIEWIATKYDNEAWRKLSVFLFWINCSLMLFMMLFRYGQRADYWDYRAIYNEAPFNRGFPLFWYTRDIHFEIGFRFLINLFTCWDAPSTLFYGLISCITWCATVWGIIHYCRYRGIAIMLVMPTLFLTYYMSGVRNGLVVALALAILPRLLLQHKYLAYIFTTLLLATLHFTALIFLLCIPIQRISIQKVLLTVPVFAGIGAIIAYSPIHYWISLMPGLNRLAEDRPGYLGIGERTCMFLLMTGLFYFRKKESILAEYRLSDCLYRCYALGYGISMASMTSAYVSQRITMPLKSIEVILIPILLIQCRKEQIKRLSVVWLCFLTVLMSCKNLNVSIDGKKWYNYSFIGIWDGPDEVMEDQLQTIRRWSTNVYNMVEDGTWVDP